MLDRHAIKAVLAAIGRGDGAAFRNLFEDRAALLNALALRLLGNPAAASEAVQQTFVEIWRLAQAGQVEWDMPDLEMIRLCRRFAGTIARQSPEPPDHGDGFEMTDPVNAGEASFELLEILQILGRMSPLCRDAVLIGFFEHPTREVLARRLALESSRLNDCLRRSYAEIMDGGTMASIAIDRETDVIAMNQALGVSATPGNAAQDPLRHAWELRFAPLAELLAPVAPPADAFDAVMQRVSAEVSAGGTAQIARRAEIWRAVLFLGIGIAAAALVYVSLVAIQADAAEVSQPHLIPSPSGETR